MAFWRESTTNDLVIHVTWHAFVIAGSMCHFVGIYMFDKHYTGQFKLELTEPETSDLIEYLKSL